MKALVCGSMVLGLGLMFLAMLQGAEPKEEVIDIGKGIKLKMVLVPAGKFMMGSTKEAVEEAFKADPYFKEIVKDKEEAEVSKIIEGVVKRERQHEVTLTKPFYMGKYEVTQEQWESIMGNNPSNKKGPKLPVTNVTWIDCQNFIKNLNANTKGIYRLPTEAEWEYSCRAGTKTAYSFGDKITIKDANYVNNFISIIELDKQYEQGNINPVQVGSYSPNAFGLYDMHGNVWEWCEDWYLHYAIESVTDPKGQGNGEFHVMRGGSFFINSRCNRSADRAIGHPDIGNHDYGFRLAREVGAEVATRTEGKPSLDSKVMLEAPFTKEKARSGQEVAAKNIKREVEEAVDLGKGVKLEMVLIPAGKFMMGSTKETVEAVLKEAYKNNGIEEARINAIAESEFERERQHEVTLTKAFYIGKYEVTQEQWESVIGNNPSDKEGVKLPVTNVSWNDCQEFIKKLNGKTKGGYRLPTEAEWEYAGRAGATTAYSFGDSIMRTDANYNSNFIAGKTENQYLQGVTNPEPVGSYKANAFGLYDMHGNVWEWCEDWYGKYPRGAIVDPKGPASGLKRVLRGGSFELSHRRIRLAVRSEQLPKSRFYTYGLRLARGEFGAEIATRTEEEEPLESKVMLESPFTKDKANSGQQVAAKSIKREVEEKEDLGKGVKLEMVFIPAGKFVMGSTKEAVEAALKDDLYFKESNKDKEEAEVIKQVEKVFESERQHEVTISKPFYIGKYEVTQDEWERVMFVNRSNKQGAKLPVTNVSWDDCQEFIKKLNAKTKGGYRLPTEAEWECAARAGTTTEYSFGDSITPKDSNYNHNFISIKEVGNQYQQGKIKPIAVGIYKPNAFGLYDMHGNIYEWCEDWYKEYPKGAVTDPKGPASGEKRVLRGGSFGDAAGLTRSATRFVLTPDVRYSYIGFRLAREVGAEVATRAEENPPLDSKVLLEAPFSKEKARSGQEVAAKSIKREVEEKEDLGKGVNLEMVLIPAGKFMMGSTKEALKAVFKGDLLSKEFKGGVSKLVEDFFLVERQHEVTISKPFYMGKYEVTQEQWESVMGSNPSDKEGAKLPVTNVSWNDCQEFIKKLNAKTKGGYRLPTETEWEYSCRAGTTTVYSFGDSITPQDANYNHIFISLEEVGNQFKQGKIKPVAVRSYMSNAFGLYDMHGNVAELCDDWFGEYPEGSVTDPKGPDSGEERIRRGGTFAAYISLSRSSFRDIHSPTKRDAGFGFRLARTP